MSKFSYLMGFSLFFNLLHLCNISRERVLNGQFFKGAHILSLDIFTAKTAQKAITCSKSMTQLLRRGLLFVESSQ